MVVFYLAHDDHPEVVATYAFSRIGDVVEVEAIETARKIAALED